MEHNISLSWLDGATPAAVAAMDADTLALLAEELAAAEDVLKARRRALDAGLAARYAPNPHPGTGWIADGGKAVRVEVPKIVEWDQDGLRAAHEKLEVWGENPAEFLTLKFSVAESAFKAWPSSIRQIFEPARTLRPGKVRVTFHEKKMEAA